MIQLPPSFEIRIALCASAPLPLLAALDRTGLAVCDVQGDPEALRGRLASLQPHVLVMDQAGADLSWLSALPCPPRVALSPDDPAEAVRAAMAVPLAAAAEASLPARLEAAQMLLDQLGMSRKLGGFAALRLGAAWLSALPCPHPPVQYWLYPLLGEALALSPAAVERRIRSAIESTWLSGSWEAQNALLGASVHPNRGKPTNSELLSRLAEIIANRVQTRN